MQRVEFFECETTLKREISKPGSKQCLRGITRERKTQSWLRTAKSLGKMYPHGQTLLQRQITIPVMKPSEKCLKKQSFRIYLRGYHVLNQEFKPFCVNASLHIHFLDNNIRQKCRMLQKSNL